MNRRAFMVTGLGLLSVSLLRRWQPNPELLIGKGTPDLTDTTPPLLKEVGATFETMQKEAALAGFKVVLVSGYRSYAHQQRIWNRKYTANKALGLSPRKNIAKIIEYSTLPGTSRHHWGTDIDIIDGNAPQEGDVLQAKKFHGTGPYAGLQKWLEQHAARFGFVAPYTNDPKRKGFYYEPWHYSYAPKSIGMLREYLRLDLESVLKTDDLLGKEALHKGFLKRYRREHILGINPRLL